MKKLFIDFDGVISDTIHTICKLYNYDFSYYADYEYITPSDIKSWSFKECTCATEEYIDTYFCQKRFFDNLVIMSGAIEAIDKLSNEYDITVVSMGMFPNLWLKDIWVTYHLPKCEFVGCRFDEYSDKSHIDMSDGIFIDDVSRNLATSNATRKICFGDKYEWNKDWNGERVCNWKELLNKLL